MVEIVTKLLYLTQDEKVEWYLEEPPDSLVIGSNAVYPLYFACEYKHINYAIYWIRFPQEIDEYNNTIWDEATEFIILGDNSEVLLRINDTVPVVVELMNTIRVQVADLDSILESFSESEDGE